MWKLNVWLRFINYYVFSFTKLPCKGKKLIHQNISIFSTIHFTCGFSSLHISRKENVSRIQFLSPFKPGPGGYNDLKRFRLYPSFAPRKRDFLVTALIRLDIPICALVYRLDDSIFTRRGPVSENSVGENCAVTLYLTVVCLHDRW